MKIGVLALQGGFIEHIKAIESIGHEAIEVKNTYQLNKLDALILPGGESTTIGKLLRITGLMKSLKEKIKEGLPVWGTCAGMILLAKEIEGEEIPHLALMDIRVKRNAFGRQIDSFETYEKVKGLYEPIELIFIRAPYISEYESNVEILCTVDNKIVAAREKNMLVTSFHSELTDDTTFLDYFIREFC
ncbi:pyridoxal 5'-phosphate synthase glutaminase subunit PdxT [Clostridium perfringens]|nr:pyridoxal 5'-phosphate synthase glutaminase subunit PdxT [Clostridium perfringens]